MNEEVVIPTEEEPLPEVLPSDSDSNHSCTEFTFNRVPYYRPLDNCSIPLVENPHFVTFCRFLNIFDSIIDVPWTFSDILTAVESPGAPTEFCVVLCTRLFYLMGKRFVPATLFERTIGEFCKRRVLDGKYLFPKGETPLSKKSWKDIKPHQKLRIFRLIMNCTLCECAQIQKNISNKNISEEVLKNGSMGVDALGYVYWFIVENQNETSFKVYREDATLGRFELLADERGTLEGVAESLILAKDTLAVGELLKGKCAALAIAEKAFSRALRQKKSLIRQLEMSSLGVMPQQSNRRHSMVDYTFKAYDKQIARAERRSLTSDKEESDEEIPLVESKRAISQNFNRSARLNARNALKVTCDEFESVLDASKEDGSVSSSLMIETKDYKEMASSLSLETKVSFENPNASLQDGISCKEGTPSAILPPQPSNPSLSHLSLPTRNTPWMGEEVLLDSEGSLWPSRTAGGYRKQSSRYMEDEYETLSFDDTMEFSPISTRMKMREEEDEDYHLHDNFLDSKQLRRNTLSRSRRGLKCRGRQRVTNGEQLWHAANTHRSHQERMPSSMRKMASVWPLNGSKGRGKEEEGSISIENASKRKRTLTAKYAEFLENETHASDETESPFVNEIPAHKTHFSLDIYDTHGNLSMLSSVETKLTSTRSCSPPASVWAPPVVSSAILSSPSSTSSSWFPTAPRPLNSTRRSFCSSLPASTVLSSPCPLSHTLPSTLSERKSPPSSLHNITNPSSNHAPPSTSPIPEYAWMPSSFTPEYGYASTFVSSNPPHISSGASTLLGGHNSANGLYNPSPKESVLPLYLTTGHIPPLQPSCVQSFYPPPPSSMGLFEGPPPSTTTSYPPPSTTTSYPPPPSTTTSYPPPPSTTTSYPPSTTSYPPPPSTTSYPPPSTTTTYPPPPSTTTTYPPPSTTTTYPPPPSTTSYPPPPSTTTSYPPPPPSTTIAYPSSSFIYSTALPRASVTPAATPLLQPHHPLQFPPYVHPPPSSHAPAKTS
ncbi:hypothetical protein IE077_003277 [Cardiosporidium cionae]|uniref:Uncharacterized protein n=1 Tax=Cardiosporidium cionae TaxID=476202 RepID=A0ABQ7J8L1_9APIC|nr:hypothetical protein IE077_003277 [Cardiosporidium cionae]|eukprot:KAF8820342.1 hypothetical protein IE077_003277 [Cardiosporidium cionae]